MFRVSAPVRATPPIKLSTDDMPSPLTTVVGRGSKTEGALFARRDADAVSDATQ
jgi:hypothetical protein